jgi:hypothetical protein
MDFQSDVRQTVVSLDYVTARRLPSRLNAIAVLLASPCPRMLPIARHGLSRHVDSVSIFLSP